MKKLEEIDICIQFSRPPEKVSSHGQNITTTPWLWLRESIKLNASAEHDGSNLSLAPCYVGVWGV